MLFNLVNNKLPEILIGYGILCTFAALVLAASIPRLNKKNYLIWLLGAILIASIFLGSFSKSNHLEANQGLAQPSEFRACAGLLALFGLYLDLIIVLGYIFGPTILHIFSFLHRRNLSSLLLIK